MAAPETDRFTMTDKFCKFRDLRKGDRLLVRSKSASDFITFAEARLIADPTEVGPDTVAIQFVPPGALMFEAATCIAVADHYVGVWTE